MDLANLAATSGIAEACEKLKQCDFTLDEVHSLCIQYRMELEQIQSELDRQVSGQVHDSSFANSMLSKAVQEMEGVSDSLQKITNCCEVVREKTPGFEHLKRATIAKRNLHSVIEQLDLYGRVPTRVKRLLSELEREPRGDNLRRVFREWLGLSAWRDRVVGHVEDEATRAAQAEERAWRRARGEILPNDTPKQAEDDSKTPSSASYETMLALLKDHFRDSYLLGDRIFEIVNETADKLFELARDRPQDLVCVAEICERRDRQVLREVKRRGLIKDPEQEFDYKRNQFLARLGEAADERAARILHQEKTHKKKSKEQKMRFEDLIQACDLLLMDLQILARDIRPCFPRSYDPLGIFRKWYEARLTREFSERIHDSVTEEELPSAEMLGLANWISRYVAAVVSFYSDVVGPLPPGAFPKDVIGLERLCDNLLDRYLTERALPRIAKESRVKEEKVYEIIKVDPKPNEAKRGYLKTNLPEDFFSILNQEQMLCSDHFSGERTLKVFETFVNFAITWFLPKQEAKLVPPTTAKGGKKSKEVSKQQNTEDDEDLDLIRKVCAWISDSARCQELVRYLFDTSAESLMRCEDVASIIGKTSDIVEDACSAFNDSALKFAKQILVEQKIFNDIETQVLPEMFTKEWEESRYLGARIIIATLEDWFFHPIQGLCDWISSDFVFGRIFLFSMERLIKNYVDKLLVWKHKFGSAKRAAGRVEEDYKTFSAFFRRNIGYLKFANSASCRSDGDIEKKFKIFLQISDILQGDEFNLDPLLESLGNNVHHTRVVIKRLRLLRGGKVFNRREVDLEKELVSSQNVQEGLSTSELHTPHQASSIYDIASVEKLGDEIHEFEGTLAAASFVDSSSVVSTDKQLQFVKKISALAKSASTTFNTTSSVSSILKTQSSLKHPTATVNNGGNPFAVGDDHILIDEKPQVLSMSEFTSSSKRS
jgi:hypothetical protein